MMKLSLKLFSLQFVVGVDGAVGITYEHCAAEGPPVIAIVDHTFSYWSVPTHVSMILVLLEAEADDVYVVDLLHTAPSGTNIAV